MWRSLYIALGILVARWVYGRTSKSVDTLSRLRQGGL